MNYKRLFTTLVLALSLGSLFAQKPIENEEPCTSIMVGRLASTDGSVMTSHSCDGNYRTWVEIAPAKKFEEVGDHKVYWGSLHTETAWDQRNLELKGSIPEVLETYAYLNTAYPCMNEKQLAIGETTIYGRRELRNKEGLFLIEELERIALQRCTRAREAIQLIGELIEEYGYGDYGECISIADPYEVWHMEIFGEGEKKIGGVWAAQRIPDEHVGVSANISRISEIIDDPDYFMASKNIKKVAKKLGFWDGEEPFKFWKAYGGGKKAFSIREYYVLSTLAPGLELDYDSEELPFSVVPDNKLSVRDVMKYYRETYEGTEYDMTQNLKVPVRRRDEEGKTYYDTLISPVANPWMSYDTRNLLNAMNPDAVQRQRTIAIAGCSYSHVIQLRSWLPDEVGGIAWLSLDNPGQSPRIPVFSGTLSLPESFNICGQHRYREDAALWSFRKANRLSTVKWGQGRKLIEPAVEEYEIKALEELELLEKNVKEMYDSNMENKSEKAKEYLTQYTHQFAHSVMNKWMDMTARLWYMFGRGF